MPLTRWTRPKVGALHRAHNAPMRVPLVLVAAAALAFGLACQTDTDAIEERLDGMEQRLEALEEAPIEVLVINKYIVPPVRFGDDDSYCVRYLIAGLEQGNCSDAEQPPQCYSDALIGEPLPPSCRTGD